MLEKSLPRGWHEGHQASKHTHSQPSGRITGLAFLPLEERPCVCNVPSSLARIREHKELWAPVFCLLPVLSLPSISHNQTLKTMYYRHTAHPAILPLKQCSLDSGSIFTELCNPQHPLIPEHFCHPRMEPRSVSSHPASSPGHHTPAVCREGQCLQINLFSTFLISDITPSVVRRDWLLSLGLLSMR